jgi:BMFP domain-containing protein YqiC
MSHKEAKKIRKEVNKAVRESRIEIESEIKDYINKAPFIQRIKFAGLALVGKI